MLAVRYSDVVVTLLHSRERVLHTYKPSVSRYVHRWLESHGVRIILDTKATELTNDTIIRDNGTTLASDVSILTAGIEPNNEVHDETLTFDFYRAQESDRILMAGDVAHHGLAATAHNAMIEGRRMADLIADDRLGLDRTYKPIQNRTMLALALGPRDGLFTWNNGHIPLPYLT
jgi:NADH dehydrogenase FAD-containing subunit